MYGHFHGEDENLLELGVACLREPHFCSFGNLSDSSDILTNSTKNQQLSYITSMRNTTSPLPVSVKSTVS